MVDWEAGIQDGTMEGRWGQRRTGNRLAEMIVGLDETRLRRTRQVERDAVCAMAWKMRQLHGCLLDDWVEESIRSEMLGRRGAHRLHWVVHGSVCEGASPTKKGLKKAGSLT